MPVKKDTTNGNTRTVRLAADVHRKLKIYAAQHDMELQDVLARAVEEFVSGRRTERK